MNNAEFADDLARHVAWGGLISNDVVTYRRQKTIDSVATDGIKDLAELHDITCIDALTLDLVDWMAARSPKKRVIFLRAVKPGTAPSDVMEAILDAAYSLLPVARPEAKGKPAAAALLRFVTENEKWGEVIQRSFNQVIIPAVRQVAQVTYSSLMKKRLYYVWFAELQHPHRVWHWEPVYAENQELAMLRGRWISGLEDWPMTLSGVTAD